jgi:hydrogenase-4 component E
MDAALIAEIIRILLVLVVVSAAAIIVMRDIPILFVGYAFQSLLLAFVAFALYAETGELSLIGVGVATIISKTLLIPRFMGKIHGDMKIRRDVEFRILGPTTSVILCAAILFVVHYSFQRFAAVLELDTIHYLGTIFGILLVFMGLLVMFSRRKPITKIVGYLTMENGVLLFSLFFAALPLVFEVIVTVDLIVLVLLSTILAFGEEGDVDAFQRRLVPFRTWILEEDE